MLADVDAVHQERHEIEAVEGRRSPGGELRRRLRDEPAAHGALAGATADHRRRQRLETARILTRRHAHEHLLDHATIQWILAGHRPKARQRDFLAVGTHARPTQRHLAAPEHDLARDGAGARGLPLHLMLIALTADGRPILFEHRLQDLQARGDREFHQLCPRVHEQINEREVALGGGFDLVRSIDCVRLSLHGGSLLAGFRPGLVTTRLPRAVRSRRSQISTVIRTSPRCDRFSLCSIPEILWCLCDGRLCR